MSFFTSMFMNYLLPHTLISYTTLYLNTSPFPNEIFYKIHQLIFMMKHCIIFNVILFLPMMYIEYKRHCLLINHLKWTDIHLLIRTMSSDYLITEQKATYGSMETTANGRVEVYVYDHVQFIS